MEVSKIATKVVSEKVEVLKKISILIQEHKIATPKITEILKEIDLRSPDTSDLEELVETISENGHGYLMSQLVSLDNKGKMLAYDICESSDKYLEAHSKFVRDCGVSIWGTLDDLRSVSYVVSSKDNPEQYLVKDRFLTKEDCINKLTRVHRHIIDKLQERLIVSMSSTEPNTLTLYSDGRIEYISRTGKIHSGKLGIKTNMFLLLTFLVRNPNQHHDYSTLETHLRNPKNGGEESDGERRIRDTISSIKEVLRYKDNDLFAIDYGCTLSCNVLIRQ